MKRNRPVSEQKENETRTKRVNKSNDEKNRQPSKKPEFAPIILFAVALLFEISLIFSDELGFAGESVRNLLCGIFGAVCYIAPVGLMVLAFFFFDIRRHRSMPIKAVAFSVFTVFFSITQSLFSDPSLSNAENISVYYNNGIAGVGGGAVGGLFGMLIALAVEPMLAGIITSLICLVALSFFIGPSRAGVWKYVFKKSAPREKKIHTPAPRKSEKPVKTEEKAVDLPKTAEPSAIEPTNVETVVSEPPKQKEKKTPDPFIYGDEFMASEAPAEINLVPFTQTKSASAPTPQPEEPRRPSVSQPQPSVYRTNENPMTAMRTGAQKIGSSRAYSPFAQPFFEEENTSAQPAQHSRHQVSGTSQEPPRAYSPFANPLASMKNDEETKTERSHTPQAYIACGAQYPSAQTQNEQPSFVEFTPRQQNIQNAVPDGAPQMIDVSDLSSNTDCEKKNGLFNKMFRREDHADTHDIYTEEPCPTIAENVEEEVFEPDPVAFKSVRRTQSAQNTQDAAIKPDYYAPPFDMDDDTDEEEYADDEDEMDDEINPIPEPPKADKDTQVRMVYGSEPRYPDYVYPTFDLLDPVKPMNQISEQEILDIRNKLLDKLASFRIEATLSGYSVGPTITRYEITPGSGVKVRQITALTEDLALALESDGVRIAAVSGKSVIGVEVPNEKVSTVSLRALLENRDFINARSLVTVCVGLTVTGKPIYMDIDDMPHVLIAGETKSGKSVAINCMILSLLYRASPDEVQLIMIDPKRVELNIYSKIPHLVMPVIDDPKRAAAALRWAVNEMDRRYMLLDKMGVRNREEYCEMRKSDPTMECMPQIIIVIDELADLMLQVREYVEELINRLAAMARACGMHLLVGTQRPSVDIITGLIKANIPARIAFKVSSAQDSRIILGGVGAEKLLGRGDMLYQATGAGRKRIQGAFVSGSEIKRLTKFIIDNNGEAEFDPEILKSLDAEVDRMNKSSKKSTYTDEDEDNGTVDGYEPDFDLLCRAIEYILETGKTSTNNIQRILHVGFNRAADIVDALEDMGFLSARDGNRPREVQVTWEMYEEWKMRKQL